MASPVAPAAADVNVPSTSAEPPTAGSSDIGSSTARMISSLHRRLAVSYINVADASEGSVASTPVNR